MFMDCIVKSDFLIFQLEVSSAYIFSSDLGNVFLKITTAKNILFLELYLGKRELEVISI